MVCVHKETEALASFIKLLYFITSPKCVKKEPVTKKIVQKNFHILKHNNLFYVLINNKYRAVQFP